MLINPERHSPSSSSPLWRGSNEHALTQGELDTRDKPEHDGNLYGRLVDEAAAAPVAH